MVIFRHFCSENCPFSMNYHYNSRNRNCKSRKIVFSFVFMRIFHESMMKNEGGVCKSFVGTKPKYILSIRFRRIFRNFLEIFLVEIFFFLFFLWAGSYFFLEKKILPKIIWNICSKIFLNSKKKIFTIFLHNFFLKKIFPLYIFISS